MLSNQESQSCLPDRMQLLDLRFTLKCGYRLSMVNHNDVKYLKQTILAHRILIDTGDVDSVSTATMLLDTPEADGGSTETITRLY